MGPVARFPRVRTRRHCVPVVFRICFGLIGFWEVCRYFAHGWIKLYWIDPKFHFTFLGFDWVPPWPGECMYFRFYLLGRAPVQHNAGLSELTPRDEPVG